MIQAACAAILFLVLAHPALMVFAQAPPPSLPHPPDALSSPSASADDLYRAGRFADAEARYRAMLNGNPNLLHAQMGLIESLLHQEKIDEAWEAASRALSAQPNSAALLAVMGDVHFRRAEMPEAEKSYLQAIKVDPKEVRAYLGLARLYRAYSLYRRAYDELKLAHDLAPDNPEVQRLYFTQLTRKQRIAAIEAYLAGPHPDDPEDTLSLQEYLDFLKATADQPLHSCKLVSKVEQTDTKLDMMYGSAQRVRGYGLTVKLNDHNTHMLLDTGASGVLMGRKAAEKAGLTRLSTQRIGGIGDNGMQTGYSAVAARIRIGELEFQDCIVRVTDKASVIEEDGLIGADVFSSYLIDIDIPGGKLRLAPLPKRPDESAAPTALNTEAEAANNQEEKSGSSNEPKDDPDAAASSKDGAKAATGDAKAQPAVAAMRLPRDRYVAPEMQNWTKIFRFGHQLLIPTYVNDSKAMLFLIDTGSFANMLSIRAARQVTNVAGSNLQVRGVNGSVGKVYTGERAALTFSHFRQNNQEIVTIDLDNICRRTGTEVSGILGFNVLRLLEIKIDYRDGLVDFVHPQMALPRN